MDAILTGAAKDNGLQYAVTVMHPQDISAGMLQRTNYSLWAWVASNRFYDRTATNATHAHVYTVSRNAQSQDVTVKLIREVVDKGYPLHHVRSPQQRSTTGRLPSCADRDTP